MATRKEAKTKRRLGKGLGSLISAPVAVETAPAPQRPAGDSADEQSAGVARIDLSVITPNAMQPRQEFDNAALQGLAESIRSSGVMQPILIRPQGAGYEIVAGERRWRAARMAGLDRIPAVVREATDQEAAEWSLVENLQREDLNPIERARAYQRLVDDFALNQEAIGRLVGTDRSNVSNHIRLLDLDPETTKLVTAGLLSMGHARSLLGVIDDRARIKLAEQIVRDGLSVRAVEQMVARIRQGGGEAPLAPPSPRQAHHADLARQMSDQLGTKVRIRSGRKKGTGSLVIDFYDAEQFDGLLGRLGCRVS